MAKRKLTPKQEAFARAYVETGNASEAYRRAYNAENMSQDVIKVKAYELTKNGHVAVTIEELQSRQQKRHEVTLDTLTEELDAAIKLAMQDPKGGSAAVAGIMGKAKLHGLAVDRSENVNTNYEISDEPASSDDWRASYATPETDHMEAAERPSKGVH